MPNIIIKATNIELTLAIREYVEKRISTISKFLKDDNVTIHVEVGKTTNHHKSGDIFRAEGECTVLGHKYYARVETDNLYSAVDELEQELSRELTSNFGKKQALFKRGAQKIKAIVKGIPNLYRKYRK